MMTEPLKARRIGIEEFGFLRRPAAAKRLAACRKAAETLDHGLMREGIGIGIMPFAEAFAGKTNAGFLIDQGFRMHQGEIIEAAYERRRFKIVSARDSTLGDLAGECIG